MVLQRFDVPEGLSRVVERVKVWAPTGGHAHVHHLPDGRATLVFRQLESRWSGDLYIFGPRRTALLKLPKGVTRALVLRVKPGWINSLFGIEANQVTDRSVALEDVWGRSGRELCHALLAAQSVPDMLDRFSCAIVARTRLVAPSSAHLARRAIRIMESGEYRVGHVASELGVTSRHLRRVFRQCIGVGPKHFARTVRLRRAVQMSSTTRDWSRIAQDTGYCDQAHLVTEFRALLGTTPGAFRQQTRIRTEVDGFQPAL